jgi:hypothetical protein
MSIDACHARTTKRGVPGPGGLQGLVRAGMVALACAVCLSPAAAQGKGPLDVEGYVYDEQLAVAGAPLQLNGVGLRAVAWLKGYSAGLYLQKRTDSAEAVLQDGGPKRIRLRVLLDVSPEEFVRGFDRGVAKNSTAEQMSALKARMERFDAMLRALGPIKKGDVFDLDFVPGQGMVFHRNLQVRGNAIPGTDFYAALLRIFLGQRPVDKELKEGMLGGPVR